VGGTLQVTGQTTLATSLSGILKAASGVVSVAVAGTDYIAGGAGAATTTLTLSGPFNTSATPVVFGSSPITSTYYGLATTTSLSSSNLLYSTNGAAGVSSVATTSLSLSGAFSHSGTLGALVGGSSGTLSLATNGVSLTNLAQIAANSILGNSTGATGNVTAVATSSLFAGTDGQVLARVNGTWTGVATTTFSGGLTYSGGNVTADLGTSIVSSEITDDTIVNADINSAAAIAYSKLNLVGSIANSDLVNSSVSFGGVSVSLGGSDATPAFDLTDATNLPIVAGTTGTLSIARGGTGTTTVPVAPKLIAPPPGAPGFCLKVSLGLLITADTPKPNSVPSNVNLFEPETVLAPPTATWFWAIVNEFCLEFI
jgi:hypothetical protein